MVMKLLLLEDDLQLGKALQSALARSEFETVWVRRVQEAREQLAAETFALALLDIGLPDGSGLDVLTWIRTGAAKAGAQLPVMMLTARDSVNDRVQGLDAGADDYLPKPFAVPELLSRIRALTRRSIGFTEQVWKIGGLAIDPTRHRAMVNGSTVELSLREFKLLVELARSAGKYVTRAQLEQIVTTSDVQAESNSLEVHIHHLRKKVGTERIKTIRGVGYLLEEHP
jgi:two-component system, OmpR family, response regulator QseB